MPTTGGATVPARLPTKFSMPVQRPEASEPSRVCVAAQWLDENTPKPKPAPIRHATDQPDSATHAANKSDTADIASPLAEMRRRIPGVLTPASMRRSAIHPNASDDSATT